MKKTILYRTILLPIILIVGISVHSQEISENKEARPIQFFIGLQPAFDGELFDEYRSLFELNIIPIQLEYAINRKWSLRISPTVFLQFKPELPAEISKVGVGITVPYHLSKKNSEEGHRGFYVGPHVALNQHKLDNFTSVTGAAEIGYYYLMNSIFSFNLGVQVGRTFQFDPSGGYLQIGNHVYPVFAFGIWF